MTLPELQSTESILYALAITITTVLMVLAILDLEKKNGTGNQS